MAGGVRKRTSRWTKEQGRLDNKAGPITWLVWSALGGGNEQLVTIKTGMPNDDENPHVEYVFSVLRSALWGNGM